MSKKEFKSIDSRRMRAAEAASLRGDRVRSCHSFASYSRDDRVPGPDPEAPSTGKKRGKKPFKRFKGCPKRDRKAHAFMEDTETYVELGIWYWRRSYEVFGNYQVTHTFKMCVYCGLVRTKSIRRKKIVGTEREIMPPYPNW